MADTTCITLLAACSKMTLISLIFFWEFSLSLSNTQQVRLRINSNLRKRCSAYNFYILSCYPKVKAQSFLSSFQYALHHYAEMVSSVWVSKLESSVTSLKMNLRVSIGISSQIRERRVISVYSECQGVRAAKGVQ